jgi:DNA topoisomerase IA
MVGAPCKVLLVAEKPSLAQSIANFLSDNQACLEFVCLDYAFNNIAAYM